MQQKKIHFYDSMGADGMDYLNHIFCYLQDEHEDKKKKPLPDVEKWELVQCDPGVTPQQRNGMWVVFVDVCWRSSLTHTSIAALHVLALTAAVVDCGVFTCMFAELVSRDCPLAFSQEHIPQCRERIALAILTGCADV